VLESIALRRWPGASSLQPVIEATLAIRGRLGLPNGAQGLAHVASARVDLPPRAFSMNGSSGWQTRLSALQSARWTVSVVIEDGEAWLEQTNEERRADAEVARFATECVVVAEDASLPSTGARVTLSDRGGREVAELIEVPAGDPLRPLAAGEIRQKLDRAAVGIRFTDRVPSIVAAIDSLESSPSIASLAAAVSL
jgi:2-methylcitrate dehydratase PrpD